MYVRARARILRSVVIRSLLRPLLSSVGTDGGSRVGRAGAFRIPIIAVASGDTQIGRGGGHLEFMIRVLGQRHALRIKTEKVLRAQLGDDVGEGLVELADVGEKRASARSEEHTSELQSL